MKRSLINYISEEIRFTQQNNIFYETSFQSKYL